MYVWIFPRSFCDIFHTIRKLGNGSREDRHISSLVHGFVEMAFGVGGKRFEDGVGLHLALRYTPEERLRLEPSTCHSANSGTGLLVTYRVFNGFRYGGVEFQADCFVNQKEPCCESVFYCDVDLLGEDWKKEIGVIGDGSVDDRRRNLGSGRQTK